MGPSPEQAVAMRRRSVTAPPNISISRLSLFSLALLNIHLFERSLMTQLERAIAATANIESSRGLKVSSGVPKVLLSGPHLYSTRHMFQRNRRISYTSRHKSRHIFRHKLELTSRYASRCASRHTSRHASRHESRRASRHATRHTTGHTTRHASRHTTKHASRHTTGHAFRQATRHTTRHASRHATNQTCNQTRTQ